MMTSPPWFSVRLVMRCTVSGKPPRGGLFEDRIIVVRAATEAEAHEKALAIGGAAREEYLNEYQEPVTWEFLEILAVKPIADSDIQPGTEVFSTCITEVELSRLRASIQTTWP